MRFVLGVKLLSLVPSQFGCPIEIHLSMYLKKHKIPQDISTDIVYN
jgi:hypothetical protein